MHTSIWCGFFSSHFFSSKNHPSFLFEQILTPLTHRGAGSNNGSMSHRPLTLPEADTFLTMRAEALRWNGTKRGEWIERHERRRMEIEADIPAASSVGTALRSSSLLFSHHQPEDGVTPMKQPNFTPAFIAALNATSNSISRPRRV